MILDYWYNYYDCFFFLGYMHPIWTTQLKQFCVLHRWSWLNINKKWHWINWTFIIIVLQSYNFAIIVFCKNNYDDGNFNCFCCRCCRVFVFNPLYSTSLNCQKCILVKRKLLQILQIIECCRVTLAQDILFLLQIVLTYFKMIPSFLSSWINVQTRQIIW